MNIRFRTRRRQSAVGRILSDAQISRSCSASTTKLLLPAVDSTPQGRVVATRTTERPLESSHCDSTSQAITPGAGSDSTSTSVALTTGSFSTKRCLCPIASIKRHSTKVGYPLSSTTWDISTAIAFMGRHFLVSEVIVEGPVVAESSLWSSRVKLIPGWCESQASQMGTEVHEGLRTNLGLDEPSSLALLANEQPSAAASNCHCGNLALFTSWAKHGGRRAARCPLSREV